LHNLHQTSTLPIKKSAPTETISDALENHNQLKLFQKPFQKKFDSDTNHKQHV
jgi:hypothetical protein